MEEINVYDIITLNNKKKYVVVSLTNYDNNIYLYIANMEDSEDTRVVLYKNSQLITITDECLVYELETIFFEQKQNKFND